MRFDPYNILHGAAVGATLGGGGQFAYDSFKNNKDSLPVMGTAIGAGAGALTSMYLKNYREKQEHTSTRKKLRPGLYYMERGIWGDINAFKGTEFHKFARHGFFLGVYDEKPTDVETERLPNGQYVVTFGGYPKFNEIGIPEDLYFAVNGKNTIAGIDASQDLRAVKSLFDADAQKFTDYAAAIHPLDLNPETSKKAIENLYNTTKKFEGTSLGDYSVFDNNCISASAELARASGLDLDKMPSYMGGIGGLYTKDIQNLPDHLSNKPKSDSSIFDFPWEKASSFKPAFTKKSKLRKAASYVRNCRLTKKAVFKAVPPPPHEQALNLINKTFFPWKDPNYVSPENRYLTRIGSMFKPAPGYTNNILPQQENRLGLENKYFTAQPFTDDSSTNPSRVPNPMRSYNNPYSWAELAHRASLPSWHKDYASPEEVNRITTEFYNAYNGNNTEDSDFQEPYATVNFTPGDVEFPFGFNVVGPEYIVPSKRRMQLHNLPMYPVEGVNYGSSMPNWWNSWMSKIKQDSYMGSTDEHSMDYDPTVERPNVKVRAERK